MDGNVSLSLLPVGESAKVCAVIALRQQDGKSILIGGAEHEI